MQVHFNTPLINLGALFPKRFARVLPQTPDSFQNQQQVWSRFFSLRVERAFEKATNYLYTLSADEAKTHHRRLYDEHLSIKLQAVIDVALQSLRMEVAPLEVVQAFKFALNLELYGTAVPPLFDDQV